MILRAKLPNIQMFCLAYELGSFTEAAKSMGVTPQAASRSVAKLEKELGVLLFRRSTRQIQITEAGRFYYQSCRTALATLEEAELQLGVVEDEPSGLVRISVPTTYGHHRFLPMLSGFRRLYPRIEIDVEISNQPINFVREGFDLAIRMGQLEDASFVAQRLGSFSFGVFASPTYLKEHGFPERPTDLVNHECGVFVMPHTGRNTPWFFAKNPKTLAPKPAIRIHHDVLGLIAFARSDGGLIQMFHFIVERELAHGELQEVLTAYSGCSRPFSLIYPKEAALRPAVRTLIDYTVHYSRTI